MIFNSDTILSKLWVVIMRIVNFEFPFQLPGYRNIEIQHSLCPNIKAGLGVSPRNSFSPFPKMITNSGQQI